MIRFGDHRRLIGFEVKLRLFRIGLQSAPAERVRPDAIAFNRKGGGREVADHDRPFEDDPGFHRNHTNEILFHDVPEANANQIMPTTS